MHRVAIFGLGAIGAGVLQAWKSRPPDVMLVCICGRAHTFAHVSRYVDGGISRTEDVRSMLLTRPDVVVEAAGHAGALEVAEAALSSSANLLLLSVGILADKAVRERLKAVATRNRTRIIIPAGALAGFDGLAAIARVPDARVDFTSIKPPQAWRGTPAADLIDLDNLPEAVTFFSGSAGEAATRYPKNANLAAAVALAGIGFEKTHVKLVADPAATTNRGVVEATCGSGSLFLESSGPASPRNPKTSAIVSQSVLAALDNLNQGIGFS